MYNPLCMHTTPLAIRAQDFLHSAFVRTSTSVAVDAFVGIQPDSVTGCYQTEYANKFRKRPDFAYQRATEEAKKQTERYNVYFDQKARENAFKFGGW